MKQHFTGNQYSVSYEDKFEGPIYLLLDLVQRKKLDIYEIKIAVIIKDFIKFIKDNKNILIDTISNFVYVASILLEIKSGSIFPSESRKEEVNGELDADILKRREEEYVIFRKVSNYFACLNEKESLFLIREAPMESQFINLIPEFSGKIRLEDMWLAAQKLLRNSEKEIILKDIYNHRKSINIADEMIRIKNILFEKEEITFKELTLVHKRIMDKIISFLSILELYKNEIVKIIQFENFGDIIIKKI